MSDNYYGWTKPYDPGFSGNYDDYAAERSAQAAPYEPTQWDGVTIEEMWEYARKESDERTVALAETWRRTSSLLQTTRENLKRHADALDAKWRSPAGRVFMSKVGAALYSLDEWKEVADKTASGLEQLAGKIEQTQRDMRELWLEYKAEQEHQAQKRKEDDEGGLQWGDIWFQSNDGKTFEEVQKEFHERAKNIVKPLADLYIDVYISNITRGGMYKGPTNAVVHTPSLAPRPTRPGAPAGPRPVAPTMSGDRPTRPDMPSRPDTTTTPTAPPPPGLPDDVRLAGIVTTPPAPPGPPPAAPPVTGTPATPPPPTPVLPLAGSQGNPRPTAPNTSRPGTPRTNLPGAGAPNPGTRGPAPNRPTLPGAGAPNPGTRSAAPNRPTLPGTGNPGPGGNPANRGAAPNRPTLPGNTGTGRPGGPRSGAPGLGTRPTGPATPPSSPRLPGSTAGPRHAGGTPARPASPPPSLGGQRGTGPATPGPRAGSPTTGRPGTPPSTARPATPSTGGTRAGGPLTPGAGARPDLTGRGAARPAPATGPAPSLGGSRGGPAVPGARSAAHRAEDELETWEYGEGDDELWTTEPAAAGSIEAPAEHRPQQQGKALGQG